VRFEVRAATGSIKLRFPRLRWAQRLTSYSSQSYAFYDLVDATLEKILGRDFFVRAGQAEGLHRVDGLFPQWAPTGPFKDRLRTPKQRRAVLLDELDPAGFKADWVPWAHAYDEMLVSPKVVQDTAAALRELARRDGYRLMALLRECMALNYDRLGRQCFEAVRDSRDELPGPLEWDAVRVAAAWLLRSSNTSWNLDPEAEGVVAEGMAFRLDDLPADGRAAALRRALRDAAEHPEAVGPGLLPAVEWGLAELRAAGLRDVEEEVLDHQKHLDRAWVKDLLREVPDDGEAAERAVALRVGIPLVPQLVVEDGEDGRFVLNRGRGTAWALSFPGQAQLALPGVTDLAAGLPARLAPGECWELPAGLAERGVRTIVYRALGADRSCLLAPGSAAPATPSRRRRRLDPQRLWRLRRELDPCIGSA